LVVAVDFQLQIGKDSRVELQIPPSLNWHFRTAGENLRLGGNPSYQLYPSNIRTGSLQPMVPSKLFLDLEKKK